VELDGWAEAVGGSAGAAAGLAAASFIRSAITTWKVEDAASGRQWNSDRSLLRLPQPALCPPSSVDGVELTK
jgi:hypothetical protein